MAHSDLAYDQAAGLRHLNNHQPVRVIAVTSGKGGVGKSNVSINLSVSLAALGKRVMLLDADLGLANVDVLMGLRPAYTLHDVLEDRCSLEEVILDAPGGIQVIPAASGISRMAELSPMEHAGIINVFNELASAIDVLVIDTAAGISDSVMKFSMASQEILVVVCDEPASITDAYALIKVLNRDHGQRNFRILSNMAESASSGRALFNKLLKVSEQFLDISLSYEGMIPFDINIKKAVQRQLPVVNAFPRSPAAIAFKKLAQGADRWPVPRKARGNLEFFMERLLQTEDRKNVESFL